MDARSSLVASRYPKYHAKIGKSYKFGDRIVVNGIVYKAVRDNTYKGLNSDWSMIGTLVNSYYAHITNANKVSKRLIAPVITSVIQSGRRLMVRLASYDFRWDSYVASVTLGDQERIYENLVYDSSVNGIPIPNTLGSTGDRLKVKVYAVNNIQ